jgi:transposase
MRKRRTNPKTFIKTWQQSESAREVAEKLNINLTSVHQRVCSYRKHGVNLKKMKAAHVGNAYDWSALAKFAEKVLPAEEPAELFDRLERRYSAGLEK